MSGSSSFDDIAKEFGFRPQPETLAVRSKSDALFIGIPRESTFQEKRIALSPESVALLVNSGHRVIIESKAGEGSNFPDILYTEAGAEITADTKKVFEAHIIIKVAPPTMDEIDMLKFDQIVFSPLHLPSVSEEYIRKLMSKRVTAVAYEYLQDESGSYPIVRAVSEIAGSTAILIASEYLSNVSKGQGIILGGISGVPPTKVVVLGAGVVGEYATRAALGLGATVKVFDNSIYKLMRLQNNIGQRIYTSVTNPTILGRELANADVAVGAIHSEHGRTPVVVSEAMVENMKSGSVIVDVSIDQGGCFETSDMTTHDKPTFIKHDVVHYCVPNISSRVSKTASLSISYIITPILLKTHKHGGFVRHMMRNAGIRNGVYLYKGSLTNEHLCRLFSIKYTNLDLIMTAGM